MRSGRILVDHCNVVLGYVGDRFTIFGRINTFKTASDYQIDRWLQTSVV